MKQVCKLAARYQVPGEDWDSLMWHNGNLYCGSFSNGKVKVLTSDLKPVTEFQAHEYPVYHMVEADDDTFFTSSSDGTIKQWEMNENGTIRCLATLEGHSDPPRRLRFLNGKLFSGDEKGQLKVWQDGKCLGTIETCEEIWDMLAIEGHFITVRHVDVTIFSVTESNEKIRSSVRNSIPGRSPLHFIEQAEQKLLCCADRNNNVINVHDLEKQGTPLLGTLEGHEAIINAMESTGRKLITGGSDKSVIAWNLDNLTEKGEKFPLEGYVNALAVTPEGNIYVAGENKFVVCLQL